MKKKLLLPIIILANFVFGFNASAQNADEIIFNQYLSQYNYAAGSFVIDTGVSTANFQKRAFLIWANDLGTDSLKRFLSLSEYDPNLNFLTEHGNTSEKFGSSKNMFPKKIIKSKFAHVYYMLAYVTNSSHKINGFKVYSSPAVYKIDGNTLGLIWARKINLATITTANQNTLIEYNDMIETSDKNIVLVGKYAANIQAKESVLSTKLNGASGALIWRYTYNTGNVCNEAANSVAETTDGRLSVTGYVKKCTPPSFNGNTDVFYMGLQSTGVPVAGVYTRFFWPTNLNIWGDKITNYTTAAGSDQLIISGYVDIQGTTGAIDRQILVMNIKQNGGLITAHHIGDSKTDICNDLIFLKSINSDNDYLIYLTGQTSNYNSQASVSAEAYFMYAKFNAATGVGPLGEFSIFPVTTPPYNAYKSRNGLEIKNADDYKKFAILATGVYQPSTSQTYSNVLLRDFNDVTGTCIKQFQPPIKQFNLENTFANVSFDTPLLKVYKESWTTLGPLIVKEPCQHIKIDPTHALNIKAVDKNGSVSSVLQLLHISPNPAQSVINIVTTDGTKLTGNYKNAVLKIYNSSMQVEKIIPINSTQGASLQVPVSQLKPGIYMIQLVRGSEMLNTSFIKE